MRTADDQDPGKGESPEPMQLPLESLPASGETAAKVRDAFPLNRKIVFQAGNRIIARLQGAAFAGEVLENQRALLSGIHDDDG